MPSLSTTSCLDTPAAVKLKPRLEARSTGNFSLELFEIFFLEGILRILTEGVSVLVASVVVVLTFSLVVEVL